MRTPWIGTFSSLCLAVCVISTPAPAQEAAAFVNPNQGFDRLYEVTADYRERAKEGTAEATLADSLLHSLVRLENEWWEAGMPRVHSDYLASLEAAAAALEVRGDSAGTLETLQATTEDLKVKAAFAEEGEEFAFADRVEVTVITLQDGVEVHGLLVRANPRAHRFKRPPQYVFNSSTSPTSRAIPPGNHVMWVETLDGTRLVCMPVTLGVGGDSSEMIRVPISDETEVGCE